MHRRGHDRSRGAPLRGRGVPARALLHVRDRGCPDHGGRLDGGARGREAVRVRLHRRPAEADRRALERGIEIHLPRYQPRSTLPLAACLWAQEQGRLRAFKHALYEAFFCEGEDIATDAEIGRAAERAELDAQEAVRAAYSPELGSRLQAIRQQAEAAGVRGVPSVLAGDGRSHWGMGGVERLLTGEPLVPRPG